MNSVIATLTNSRKKFANENFFVSTPTFYGTATHEGLVESVGFGTRAVGLSTRRKHRQKEHAASVPWTAMLEGEEKRSGKQPGGRWQHFLKFVFFSDDYVMDPAEHANYFK